MTGRTGQLWGNKMDRAPLRVSRGLSKCMGAGGQANQRICQEALQAPEKARDPR